MESDPLLPDNGSTVVESYRTEEDEQSNPHQWTRIRMGWSSYTIVVTFLLVLITLLLALIALLNVLDHFQQRVVLIPCWHSIDGSVGSLEGWCQGR